MAIKLMRIQVDQGMFAPLENKWSEDRDSGNNDKKGQ